MKVYVLRSHCSYIDGDRVEGIFSTREKARHAQKILAIDGIVDEMAVDEIRIEDWHPLGPGVDRGEIVKF